MQHPEIERRDRVGAGEVIRYAGDADRLRGSVAEIVCGMGRLPRGISDREQTGAGAGCDRAQILRGPSATAEQSIRDIAAVDVGLDYSD